MVIAVVLFFIFFPIILGALLWWKNPNSEIVLELSLLEAKQLKNAFNLPDSIRSKLEDAIGEYE